MAESRRGFLKQSVATVAAASVAACAPEDGRNPPTT
ncbi:MAG: twin-arginine translocation signal domain-containing protein, partial [Gemmatimonadetes bacterium]|nr:twin-arginine translocation signal domain-containing protein [Gemmatimonadota bacterium]